MPTYGLNDQTPQPFPTAAASSGGPIQNPGNNLKNPGYDEQTFLYNQNRLMNDPAQGMLQNQYQATQQAGRGEQHINQNLGTLNGPGQGEQYWNQMDGQYMNPFAGEQFARLATQQMGPQGAASAFNTRAQGQYNQMANYQGAGNTQQQYVNSQNALQGGTQGEQNLTQIGSQYGTAGRYTDPNRAAGQYQQTQGAFGALPVAEFDPFYDRARQLATQDYNRQSAGRGVYGSSEALSGVGNVITDIEAQRANRSFDAEMQRSQEQRARQQLLGEQARMGDQSALDAFGANLQGAKTYADINTSLGNQALARQELLGNQANAADARANEAQNTRISGMSALGQAANAADVAETNRFTARTGAMNDADKTALDRMNSGAEIAFKADDSKRQDFTAQADAAFKSGQLENDRERLGADIGNTISDNDLNRLEATQSAASGAESSRQQRLESTVRNVSNYSRQVQDAISDALDKAASGNQADWENSFNTELLPFLQDAGLDDKQIEAIRQDIAAGAKAVTKS